MMEDDIQQKISLALEKGVPMSAIAEHLASHENPDYQAYGKSWIESSSAAPSLRTDYQTQASKPTTKTGLLDYLEQNPQEALGYGAVALALLQGPKIASKIADYRLKQRELGLKERSLNAYEAQVAKQGVTAAPPAVNPQDDLIEAVRQNEFEQQKAVQPTAREMRDQIALQREQLKLEQDRLKHENFVRQNTWSPEEIALGRRIKDPAEMAIAQKIIAQKANQAGIAPTPQTPKFEPSDWLKQGMVNTGPVAPPTTSTTAPVEPTAAPAPAPAPKTPTVVEPATVVSTGTTPEAAAAPIVKAEEVKKVVTPPPPGMKPQYTKKKGEIGPGGYNWFASQVGHEEAPLRWEQAYGKTNVPHAKVQKDYSENRYPPSPKTVEGKSGGAFGKPEFIPEHIKGFSTIKGLAGLTGVSGLLMAASSPEAKAAMDRASAAIKDIGISPEAILRGKGDELGRMGNAYVNAGNVNYLRELQSQLQVEKDPERKQILLREMQKIGAIAPPTASR